MINDKFFFYKLSTLIILGLVDLSVGILKENNQKIHKFFLVS